MSFMDDEGRNPIDFWSQGQRSNSILPTCKGMPRFALSSLDGDLYLACIFTDVVLSRNIKPDSLVTNDLVTLTLMLI